MIFFWLFLIIGFVLTFVLLPIRDRKSIWVTVSKEGPSFELKSLREQKASTVVALRELDFDYEMGKLSKDDYKGLREKYQAQAVQIMKQLEDLEADWKKIQSKLEREIEVGFKYCSSCGKVLNGKERFCSHCGTAAL